MLIQQPPDRFYASFLVYPEPFCFAYPLFVGTANVRREADTDPKGLLLLSFTDRSVRHYSTKSVSGRGQADQSVVHDYLSSSITPIHNINVSQLPSLWQPVCLTY